LDPDACFPLRLQRDGLRTADYPFGEALARDLLVDLIAWLFYHGPESQFPFKPATWQLVPWLHPVSCDELLVLAPEGYGLRIGALLDGRPAKNVLFVRGPLELVGNSDSDAILFTGTWDDRDSSRVMPLHLVSRDKKFVSPKRDIHICSYGDDYSRYLEETRPMIRGDIVKWRGKEYYVDAVEGRWQVLMSSKSLSLHTQLGPVPPSTNTLSGVYFTEALLPKHSHFHMERWYLDSVWQQYFGNDWIPYNRVDRFDKFKDAARTFSRYYSGTPGEKP
jgi:hypothetical protein